MVTFHIKFIGIRKLCNMVANILHAAPPPPPHTHCPPRGQKVKIQFFQNMVMLHIKLTGIRKCNNMVAKVLSADPPTPHYLGDGVKRSKFNFIRTISCCISNYRESQKQQLGTKHFAYRPLTSPHSERDHKSKFNFFRSWSCCVSNLLESQRCSNMVANVLPADPPPPLP